MSSGEGKTVSEDSLSVRPLSFLSAWFGTIAAMQSHHAGAHRPSDDDLPYGMKYSCLHDSAQMAAMVSHHGSRSEVASLGDPSDLTIRYCWDVLILKRIKHSIHESIDDTYMWMTDFALNGPLIIEAL